MLDRSHREFQIGYNQNNLGPILCTLQCARCTIVMYAITLYNDVDVLATPCPSCLTFDWIDMPNIWKRIPLYNLTTQ